MNDIREIKCEACPRVCPEDYQKMVEKYSRACQERDRANELLQKGQEKHRWIPVTERLPEKNDDGSVNVVLVTNGYLQHMAYFANGNWHFAESGEMKETMFYAVTHWMPLPEPPEEVTV